MKIEWEPREIKARAVNAPWYRGIEFQIVGIDNVFSPRTSKLGKLEWQDWTPGEIPPETFGLNYEQAQTLMDDHWACGLRPTEGKGSAGSLAATEKHLEDMRVIVFDRLKIAREK